MSRYSRILSTVFALTLFTPSVKADPADQAYAQELIERASKAKASGTPLSQSQAHMSVPKVQQRMLQQVSDLVKNKKIIEQTLKKEQELKNTHYVFYTAIPYFHLFQDVTRKMYKRTVGSTGGLKDKSFQFIRYLLNDSTYSQYKDITAFLLDEIQKFGCIDDNEVRLKTILVSSNLSLLGNIGYTGESTWYFFNNPQPWGEVRRDFLEASLVSYGYSTQFLDELIGLTEYLKDEAGNLGSDLFQICIPKNMVDSVGYVSWRIGIPYDTAFIPKVFGANTMKEFTDKNLSYLQTKEAIASFRAAWTARDPQVVSAVNQHIENVKRKHFYLSPFLNKYTSTPESVPPINNAQARLLISNKTLLNPASNIRFYRYYELNPDKEKTYKAELKSIINRMEEEKLARKMATQ